MRKPCETCSGSGQISYFKGVSRFLLSWEECPDCAGIGYRIPLKEDSPTEKQKEKRRTKLKKKKNPSQK